MKFYRSKRLYKNKRFYIIIIFFMTLLFISVGYSYLSTPVSIKGTSSIAKNTWDIHYENVVIKSDSNISVYPSINYSKNLVSFSVTLNQPGDIYHFTIDIVNAGTINAMVNLFTKTNLTSTQQEYLDFSVKYSSGQNINQNNLLSANSRKTIDVYLKYKEGTGGVPQEENLTLSFNLNYTQADENAYPVY